jgi:hypothetical protein
LRSITPVAARCFALESTTSTGSVTTSPTPSPMEPRWMAAATCDRDTRSIAHSAVARSDAEVTAPTAAIARKMIAARRPIAACSPPSPCRNAAAVMA